MENTRPQESAALKALKKGTIVGVIIGTLTGLGAGYLLGADAQASKNSSSKSRTADRDVLYRATPNSTQVIVPAGKTLPVAIESLPDGNWRLVFPPDYEPPQSEQTIRRLPPLTPPTLPQR